MNDEPIPLEDEIYEEEIEVEEETSVTMAMWGDITGDIDNQTDLKEALDAKQDNLTQAQLDAVNSGINSTKVETYDGYQAQINTRASQSALETEVEARRQADSTLQGNIDAEETARKASDKDIQDVLDGETLARQNADTALGGRIDTEIHNRQVADIGLQGQIDAITSKSDVVDVVATYADLQAYDTQHLGNNDVIKVLDDETHDDALTYYRWSKTNQTWTFIGQEAPYYSKSQTDTLLLGKQNTIDSSHKLSADLVEDTSTTNKFVTAQDITNWNGKQDALTAGTGIDITSGIISTPAIVPEVVTELPTTGAEGKLYLTPKAHTAQTATGNPITATVAEEAGKLESFQLDGDTFQQTYTGKNLVATTRIAPQTQNGVTCTWDGASFTLNGTSTASTDFYGRGWWGTTSDPIALPAGTYTMSLRKSDGSLATDANFSVDCYYGTTWVIGIYKGNSGAGYRTLTLDSDTQYSVFYISLQSGKTYNNEKFYIQLEKSESPTSYEPFVGGQPSPNPSYPQDINVVTGTQTISINGTNYPISLGTIKLCDIGGYQDYIHKVGEDWIITKRTTSILLNEYSSIYRGNFGTNPFYTALPQGSGGEENTKNVISDYFYGIAYTDRTLELPNSIFNTFVDNSPVLYIRNTPWATVEDFKSWLSEHNVKVYSKRTPIDTTITDTTLIAQLEAIRTAALQNGANTITNSATAPNLAGDMEVGYYGYNPTNRYDKWLWLDINNEYEQIGGE